MGEVIPWPKQSAILDAPDVVLRDESGRGVVTLTADGRVVCAGDLDEATRAFWTHVESRIHEHWEGTTIPRLQAQVRLLAKTLDEEVPGWRERLRSSTTG